MEEYTVEFVDKDTTITVSQTETIMKKALAEGINVEYSCRVGMCLACTAEIIDGEVTQPAARALPADQRSEYALTCMARPQSDLTLRMGVYPPSIEPDSRVVASE